jgi:ABC-type transport system involved in cytochrome bd biosynthesis fused ATPase/permease subunit
MTKTETSILVLFVVLRGLFRLSVALVLLACFPVLMLILYCVQWSRGKV